jgi:hypothetical protein
VELRALADRLPSFFQADSAVVCRSFSGHERANYGREAGTDARKVAVSQQGVRNACLGDRTLDQEAGKRPDLEFTE